MDFHLSEDLIAVRDLAREFAAKEIAWAHDSVKVYTNMQTANIQKLIIAQDALGYRKADR